MDYPIYVISLKRDEERRLNLQKQFGRYNEFKIIDAVDAKNFSASEYYKAMIDCLLKSCDEKYKFKITNKIDYKEANKLYTSLGMAAGTMALGGIFKYVLQNHINIPFIVIICGAIVAFGVTYFSKPSADKRNLEKAVNEFLDKTKKEFIAWFDEIEKYYNKRVKDIINYFEEK